MEKEWATVNGQSNPHGYLIAGRQAMKLVFLGEDAEDRQAWRMEKYDTSESGDGVTTVQVGSGYFTARWGI